MWQRGIKMLMDSYVVGFNGVTAATYSSRQFNYDAVLADPGMGPCSAEPRTPCCCPPPPIRRPPGIFVHSFQYAQLIRDHLTQEPLGVVILNISEVSLYSQYLRHQSADNRFFLTDGSGTHCLSPGQAAHWFHLCLYPGGIGRPGGGDVPLPPH